MQVPPVLIFIFDVLVLSSDLITGKSIPVLVGIARLPIDQFLAGVILSMGAVSGVLFSHFSSWHVKETHRLGQANRLTQLFFSLFLSLALFLSLSRGIHYSRGVIMSIIPGFCVAAQTLPQRESTALVAFLLSFAAYCACMVTPVEASRNLGVVILEPIPHVLRGLNEASQEEDVAGVWETVLRALQLFVLGFYACVQHGLIRPIFGDKENVYASHHFARQRHYSLFVGLVSALIRVSVWYGACFVTNNTLRVMLENDLSRGGWDWVCCVLYSSALLYSACWTATQIREQLLPCFGLTSIPVRLKLLVWAMALAALYRLRDAQIAFALTTGLSLACIAVTAFTLKEW